MEGFATGFNLEGNTKPGFAVENGNFKLTFSGVFCDERKNIVSHGFECCYDWSEVMNMVLEATEDYDNMVEVEEKAEKVMRKWLTTFQGWGLLSSILPIEKHRYFILSLAYASSNWNEATGGPYSTEKIFNTVKFVYENCPGKEIRHLLPRLGVFFEEIVDLDDDDHDTAMEANERKKNFTIFFIAKWMLEVKFVIEKKRVNRNLLDLAAEAVAETMSIEDDIDNLEIPKTLFEIVYDKFKDVEWVRSYYNLRAELESAKIEMNDEEFAEALQEADKVREEAAETKEDTAIENNEEADHGITENDESSEHTQDVNDENLSDELVLKEIEHTLTDSNPAEVSTEDGFDFVSGWGAMYLFLVIFAYLCV